MATYYKTFFQHTQFSTILDEDQSDIMINAMVKAYNSGQLSKYRSHVNTPGDFDPHFFPKVLYGCTGLTICTVEDRNKNVVATGYAFFVPPDIGDDVSNQAQRQFSKAEGRRISLRKAKREMGLKGLLKDAKFVLRWSDLAENK